MIGRDAAVRDWDRHLDGLVTLLRDTDPSAAVPNWSTAPDTAAFWARRTASDLLLGLWHRRDPLELLAAGDRDLVASWPHI